MTSVVISQPMYFPWPGFIAQLSLADIVVWLDDAQFSKGSFTNRVQVRMPGGMSWLSIPLVHGGGKTRIADLVAAKPDWIGGHISKVSQSLQGTPHRATAMACVEELADCDTLCDAIIQSAQGLAAACGVSPARVLRSSELGLDGQGSGRVLDMVKMLGGTRYITGHGARNYLDHPAFDTAGIDVEYMDYDVVPWGGSGAAFTPFVTALDLLAHVGAAEARAHLNPKTVHWTDFVR